MSNDKDNSLEATVRKNSIKVDFLSLGLLVCALVLSAKVAADAAPDTLRMADVKANGTYLQIARQIDLVVAATVPNAPGFPPAPNTLYFSQGRVFQPARNTGPF